jgi:hypothetical protein
MKNMLGWPMPATVKSGRDCGELATCRWITIPSTRLIDPSPATTYPQNLLPKIDFDTMPPHDWHPKRPYNALPRKRGITARATLAEIKLAAELIPSQATLINTLPLLEAKDIHPFSVCNERTWWAICRLHGWRHLGTATQDIQTRTGLHRFRAALLLHRQLGREKHHLTPGGFALPERPSRHWRAALHSSETDAIADPRQQSNGSYS